MHDTNEKNVKANKQFKLREVIALSRLSSVLALALVLAGMGFSHMLLADNVIPEPMTMAFAVSRADSHPSLMASMADIELSKARELKVGSQNDLSITLNGRLQWIGPSEMASNQSHDDHKISLNARKILYDFGRNSTSSAVAQENVRATEWQLEYQRGLKILDIKRRYLDVLLADLDFAAENEAISIAFIRTNRLEQRSGFGEVSELDVLEAQSSYQLALLKRNTAELSQRSSRAMFAEVIGLPNKLSEDFEKPNLDGITAELPSLEELRTAAMENQLALKSVNLKIAALTKKLKASQLKGYPILAGFGEVADYSRTEGGSDNWKLGVELKVPLYQGDRMHALSAEVRAESAVLRAKLIEIQASVRQEVLTLWQNIRLLKLSLNQVELEMDSRDLYLDKARALYQMNVRSDLGDAMTRFSRTKYKQTKVAFNLLLAREKLRLLTGHDLQVKATSAH